MVFSDTIRSLSCFCAISQRTMKRCLHLWEPRWASFASYLSPLQFFTFLTQISPMYGAQHL